MSTLDVLQWCIISHWAAQARLEATLGFTGNILSFIVLICSTYKLVCAIWYVSNQGYVHFLGADIVI